MAEKKKTRRPLISRVGRDYPGKKTNLELATKSRGLLTRAGLGEEGSDKANGRRWREGK